MAVFELAALSGPVSDDEPCGPDLELAGDPDYMNYMARAEGLLPASYFSGPEGKPFDRASIEFSAEFEAIQAFLGRTRDLRLLTLLAKLLILNRDLAGFVTCIGAIDALLDQRWDDVHPRGEDGDFTIRMAALETLDDMPPVIFPLQYAPLANHRRFGAISYRSHMIAAGEVKAREGEEEFDAATVDQALMEAELPQLIENRRHFDSLNTALANIRTVWIDRVVSGEAVKLEKLPAIVGRILTLLDGVVTKRDPTAAPSSLAGEGVAASTDGAPAAVGSELVKSTSDVAAALAAAADYFARFEPSNPALLLVRQAEQLMGKSFLEVMRILVPTHVEQAAILLGKEHTLELPLERLSAFAEIGPLPPEVTPLPEETTGSEEATASDETAPAEDESPAEVPEGDGASDSAVPPSETVAHERRLIARTRREAMALLEQIGAYYRVAEPSSPVPVLTERARALAERDFLSLLKDLLPETAFKTTASGS